MALLLVCSELSEVRDHRFTRSALAQEGHVGGPEDFSTSNSNSCPQSEQLYSKIGRRLPLLPAGPEACAIDLLTAEVDT